MAYKTCILSTHKLATRLISKACEQFDITLTTIDEAKNFEKKLQSIMPDIIFIDESFGGQESSGMIDVIRSIENLEETYIVFSSKNVTNALKTSTFNSDVFLPIPFSKMKFSSILRGVLGEQKRILIASDDDEVISGLTPLLDKAGFSVYSAECGDSSMQIIHKVFPDLVIADYALCDMNGIELCERIKKTNLAFHIPVLILSKNDNVEIIETCFEKGAHDVLLPPFARHYNIVKITDVVSPVKKGRKLKALIIDDSPMIRTVIAKMFKKLGFNINLAENGLEGLKATLRSKPDIITCDYDMPIMNGWDFCIEAKKNDDIAEIPIIMVTARGTNVDKKKGKVLGVADYLTKPFKDEEFQKIVSKTLLDEKLKKERAALSKYVASDVLANVNDVIDGVTDRKPVEKFITIFFSDICSFTPKCERLSPKAIVNLLNSYFDLMISIMFKHNAIVDKFIGDAIVARFDSGDTKRDALDAVSAAYEMLRALKRFNEEAIEPIEIRIGINSGNVVLGNIGSQAFRLDYTMIGDNVNIGQRLESQAPHLGCLISEPTYALVKDHITVGEAAHFTLKGKKQTVTAYPLISVSGV